MMLLVGLSIFAAVIFIWPYLLLQQIPAMALWRAETSAGRQAASAINRSGISPFHALMPLPWTPYVLAIGLSWRRVWANTAYDKACST
jgi:hypothetical protein